MRERITIVTPVYNDWESFNQLLSDIAAISEKVVGNIHIVAINDCSTDHIDNMISIPDNVIFEKVDLVTNVGHQRAILVGLCHCLENMTETDYVIVMDSDGEDNPNLIKELLNECVSSNGQKIIFAKRSKRTEKLSFKFFYFIYKILFKILTGQTISFGNFSCIPKHFLSKICNDPNFWNHYSAAVIKSKIPYSYIPTIRGKRYFGSSKMNFNSLVLHGLSSFSVHLDLIVVRILKLNFIILFLNLIGFLLIISVKYFTALAIPGWATNIFGFLLNTFIMIGFFSLLIFLSNLNNRNKPIILPLRFYHKLIQKKTE